VSPRRLQRWRIGRDDHAEHVSVHADNRTGRDVTRDDHADTTDNRTVGIHHDERARADDDTHGSLIDDGTDRRPVDRPGSRRPRLSCNAGARSGAGSMAVRTPTTWSSSSRTERCVRRSPHRMRHTSARLACAATSGGAIEARPDVVTETSIPITVVEVRTVGTG
jgi:hypothetical protein